MARSPWLPHDAQTVYREHYRATRPGWRSSGEQFDDLVESRISAESAVLDLGCGRTGGIERFWRDVRLAVGIDPDVTSLAERGPGMPVVRGGGEQIPFRDETFDLVVSVWVLEHLDHPDAVFQEVARVLKPGGHFIFLTPNARNPLVVANRVGQLAPKLQQHLVSSVYGRDSDDTFAVRYRVNTVTRLRAAAGKAGLSVAELRVIPDPTYVAFTELLFRAAVLAERMLPAGLGVHLLGDLQKR
jgi:SAM-dependent methyltransferase